MESGVFTGEGRLLWEKSEESTPRELERISGQQHRWFSRLAITPMHRACMVEILSPRAT